MLKLRTPDERFADLPDFPYTPRYCEVDDDEGGTLRMAWVEAGPADADPILMLHGEPTWSLLYRRDDSDPDLRGASSDLPGSGRVRSLR